MRAVTQHNRTQVGRRLCRKHLPAESPRIQQRQVSRVVYMCMCQKHVVNQRIIHRNLAALKRIGTLLHSAVNKDVLTACLQKVAASGHLVVCSYKGKFHTNSSFISFFSRLYLYLF